MWLAASRFAVVLALHAQLAGALEKVISVDLCPPYSPGCANTWVQVGASAGDTCTMDCKVNAGDTPPTRWCSTSADQTGNAGTPWGWCAQTPGADAGSGGGEDEEEKVSMISIAVIGVFVLYVVGGTFYTYKVRHQPHVCAWGGARRQGESRRGNAHFVPIGPDASWS